ncbi:small ribosomal subunit protein eS27-like [Pantherophis guttatus]|uniref:Small ribosomal subunit protein eS27-like n=1 Tax=Pantherophis guttatus TaxID=94885 RepID=A0A6P9D0G8_PANGU|nr:small ribosomal subunit protein eS27-like [Pantherophis guttatus]
MLLAKDLLHSSPEEKRKHKKKRLLQSPNSYFMDVKCPSCYKITNVFNHAQTVVLCVGCSTVLCQPTGGKGRLTEGCSGESNIKQWTLGTGWVWELWEQLPVATLTFSGEPMEVYYAVDLGEHVELFLRA